MHTSYAATIHTGEPTKASPLTLEWNADRHFETAAEAWQALADERSVIEDNAGYERGPGYSPAAGLLAEQDGSGDLWLADPGHDPDDDQHAGRTYTVSETN